MKKILKVIFIILILIIFYIVIALSLYLKSQNENQKLLKYLEKTNKSDWFNYEKNSYYQRAYKILEPHLLMHRAYYKNKKLDFIKFDYHLKNDYTLPKIALEKADVLIGYGIGKIIHLENSFSELYKKKSYAFDCGTRKEEIQKYITSPLCEFQEECIKTDSHVEKIYISNNKIHSFEDKLKELNLENKKIYIKMSITGAEYDAMPEILKYSNQTTGISIEINLEDVEEINKAIKLLKSIENDFVLVYRATFNITPLRSITLSYINKNLITKDYIPLNQSNNIKFEYYGTDEKNKDLMINSNINPIVVIAKKLKLN